MSNRLRVTLRVMGMFQIVLALSMLVPMGIAYMYHETKALEAFVTVICTFLIFGIITLKLISPSPVPIKSRDGFIVVSMGWILASVIGALPMWISGAIPNFIDAFFESCSGFSTTGASILTDIEALPKSILFWRSFTHWLGGMGIVVFVTALLPSLGINGQLAANAETPGPTKDKITSKYRDTAKDLYIIYIVLTIAESILLKAGGISWYDSLIHTFGTVGTGGFSCYGDSIGHFGSAYIEWVIIIFMILAGLNFNLYYFLGKGGGLKRILADEEAKFYFSVIGVFSTIVFACLVAYHQFEDMADTFRHSVFQVVSILTTTGYMTADYDIWPTCAKMFIFMLFFIGGCSSSTSGGIKGVRFLIAIKLVRRVISVKAHPYRIATVTYNKKELGNDVVINITYFLFAYILLLAAGFLLISLDGFDLVSSLSAAATCLGNIGPGFNIFGPTMNFSVLSPFATFVCSILMIFGRLELFTLLILFSRHFWNANKA